MMKMRYVTFGSLLALAALLFMGLGANEAKASPFSKTFTATVIPLTPGVAADVSVTYGYGLAPDPNRSFPSSSTLFTPNGWGIPDCSGLSLASQPVSGVPGPNPCPYPMGNTTGSASTTTTFGILNGACAANVPIFFPGSPASTGLQNASTDPTYSLAVTAGFANLIADTNPADAIMDGAEHWNDLLVALMNSLNVTAPPLERQVATANLFGTTIWVDVVTFNPGDVPPFDPLLGFPTLVIVENFSPALPATPGLITDVCGTSITLKQNGSATNLAVHRSNPAASGTYFFFLNSVSQRDADNDGFVNSLDTCPFTTNAGSPLVAGQSANGDDVAESSGGDGIDSACEAPHAGTCCSPTTFDGTDADGDVFLNRGDNCPQDANPSQLDTDADGIGDACDVNPTVADGHFHVILDPPGVCIGFPDTDGDGYCDSTELDLGSCAADPCLSPFLPGTLAATSTSENLAVLTTCSDETDNDRDGNTDLADTGCQAVSPTKHDVKMNSTEGPGEICKDANHQNVATYKIRIGNESHKQAEPAEVGLIIDPVPGTNGSGAAVTAFSSEQPMVVTANGPTNNDGDNDVEWLFKALITVKKDGDTNVLVTITFPPCSGPPINGSRIDYMLKTDVCHGNDPGRGLFGEGDCGAAADGGQDTRPANDAVRTKNVNDKSK